MSWRSLNWTTVRSEHITTYSGKHSLDALGMDHLSFVMCQCIHIVDVFQYMLCIVYINIIYIHTDVYLDVHIYMCVCTITHMNIICMYIYIHMIICIFIYIHTCKIKRFIPISQHLPLLDAWLYGSIICIHLLFFFVFHPRISSRKFVEFYIMKLKIVLRRNWHKSRGPLGPADSAKNGTDWVWRKQRCPERRCIFVVNSC